MNAISKTQGMQQTMAQAFRFEGVGIHTGQQARVTVHPADVDTGRVFRVNRQMIPAHADWVVDTTRCTTLGREGTRLHTVEHLLSALNAYQVDNALIEVEGNEIPILDGSALPHAQAIEQSGIIAQDKPAPAIKLTRELSLEDRGSQVHAVPGDSFVVEVCVEFSNWWDGKAEQYFSLEQADASAVYQQTIAPARTFAFRQEVEKLLAMGLARGGSLDNALIITPPDQSSQVAWMETQTEFSTPLRLPKEWCAHKLLDLIGDLALFNARPQMTVTATRPGHGSNVRFVQAVLKQERH